MNENEKQAYNYLEKYIKWETFGERNLERDIETILNLIDKQQKEIEELKTITRAYNSYMCDDVKFKFLIADARYFFYDGGYFIDRFISKDKIKEIIEKHKKSLSNEFSNYDENNIENRKAIQYALARLSFLLEDIFKN